MPRVVRSTILDAPIDRVWPVLRDFNAHRDWHSQIQDSLIEDGRRPHDVGAVRRFRLIDGAVLREQLLTLSDRDRTLTYALLEAPIPLINYVARIEARPVTDGARTFWRWSSEFDCPPERADELARLVAERIYETGFTDLRRFLARGGERQAVRPIMAPERPSSAGETSGAIVVRSYGGPEVMEWASAAVPPPDRGEITVRHTAIGVNFIDVYCRTGYFRLLQPPGTPGMEGVGVVEAVGPDVVGLKPGDRIGYACAPVGAYAERRTMPAALVVPLPDGIDDETAAATLLKGMAAEFLLHRVHALRPEEIVVIHAAAGGIGVLLAQWASALGATVIGIVGSGAKAGVARSHGCAHALVAGEDVPERVLTMTGGRGADVIYDGVGRDSLARDVRMLAPCGHVVSYGQASGPLDPFDIASLAERSGRVSRPNFGHYAGTPAQVTLSTQRLFDALRRGWVRPLIGARFPLRDAVQAHRRLESRESVGATLLIP